LRKRKNCDKKQLNKACKKKNKSRRYWVNTTEISLFMWKCSSAKFGRTKNNRDQTKLFL